MPSQNVPDRRGSELSAQQVQTVPRVVAITVPFRTICMVVACAIACFFIYELLSFFLLLFMSVLLAVTFEPVVRKLSRHVRHSYAVGIVAVAIGVAAIGAVITIIPPFFEQFSAMYQNLPAFAERVGKQFPQIDYYLKDLPKKLTSADASAVSPLLAHLASFSGAALGWASSLALIFAFQVYLLFDGARVYDWFIAFFNHQNRSKIEMTCKEVAPIISAYVIGQIITSLISAIFTYVILSLVGVPGALVMAVLAGVFDVLPIVGFFMFALPAALFALSVSTQAMIIVIVGFGTYHFVETYVICPLVYGNRLRVSGIVVLFALVAGATIGGILGAILILPVVASYPKIEEIWLSQFVGRGVVAKHKEIADEDEGKDPKTERLPLG